MNEKSTSLYYYKILQWEKYIKHASKNKRRMEEYIVPLFHWKGIEVSWYMGRIFQLVKFWFKLFYFIIHGSYISKLIHIVAHLMTNTVKYIYSHKNKSHLLFYSKIKIPQTKSGSSQDLKLKKFHSSPLVRFYYYFCKRTTKEINLLWILNHSQWLVRTIEKSFIKVIQHFPLNCQIGWFQ